jgi:hypothetical protein
VEILHDRTTFKSFAPLLDGGDGGPRPGEDVFPTRPNKHAKEEGFMPLGLQ